MNALLTIFCILYRPFFLLLSFILLLFAYFLNDIKIMMVACITIWLHNVFFGISNIKKNCLYLAFHLTFFLFLMGRVVTSLLCGQDFGVNTFESVKVTVLLLEYISLFCLFLGAKLPEIKKRKLKIAFFYRKNSSRVEELIYTFGTISKYFFYFTCFFYAIQMLEEMHIVRSMGYLASYTITSTRLPAIVIRLAITNEYFFYGFCASLPSKSKSLFPIFLYLLGGLFSIGSGIRSTVILRFLFIILYFLMRDALDRGKWIGKSEKFLVVILAPIAVWFMVWYGYARSNLSYKSGGFGDLLFRLFQEQGISVSVLCYQQEYQNANIMQQNFTFGALWTFLTRNVISQTLFGTKNYFQNTIEMATYGHSLGQSLSYLVLDWRYLAGQGLGSSYIAEVMQDYGWTGVVLINVIYGAIIKKFRYFCEAPFLIRLYNCYMIRGILYSPRDTAIGPFISFFTFSSLLSISLMWILAEIWIRLKYFNSKETMQDKI